MATEPGTKRTKMIVLGSAIVVLGLAAAAALWISGGSRRTDAVKNLARAPIGCDTTLDFSVPGEYLVFVESKGTFAEVRGDCDAAGDFEVEVSRPEVDITVLDPDGAQLELQPRRDAVTYATPDFVGRSVFALDVEEAGDHVMRVEAGDEADFAVAVGRDPNAGVALLRGAAVLLGVVGLVLGLLLALVAGRKRQPAVPGWTPAQPAGQWPAGPQPGQPPYNQPIPPTYTQPGAPVAQPPYVQPGAPVAQPPYVQPGAPAQPVRYQQPGSAIPQPPPAAVQAPRTPDVDAAAAHAAFAPSVPTANPANPFAPPVGAPQNAPTGGAAPMSAGPTSPGTGDGEMGWPGDVDDDAPTPPKGSPITSVPTDVPPQDPIDRWNTSRQAPPN